MTSPNDLICRSKSTLGHCARRRRVGRVVTMPRHSSIYSSGHPSVCWMFIMAYIGINEWPRSAIQHCMHHTPPVTGVPRSNGLKFKCQQVTIALERLAFLACKWLHQQPTRARPFIRQLPGTSGVVPEILVNVITAGSWHLRW